MKTDLIEILYSEKVILDGKRTEQDVAFSVERAARINSLMERKIFNEEFIRELQQRTPYSEIESCYTFIVKTIMSRANRFGECPNAQLKKIKKGKGDRRAWMSGTIAVLLKPEAVIGPYENS